MDNIILIAAYNQFFLLQQFFPEYTCRLSAKTVD